jgi:hypothetical protein
MLDSRHTLRGSLIAVLAIWGAVSAFPASVEAGTGHSYDVSASRVSCCVLRPEACTSACRDSSPVASLAAGVAASPALGKGAQATCNPVRCECRSSEPVAPTSKPEGRRGGGRSDFGEPPYESRLLHMLSAAPPEGAAFRGSNLLRLPLHLFTTHLRF